MKEREREREGGGGGGGRERVQKLFPKYFLQFQGPNLPSILLFYCTVPNEC